MATYYTRKITTCTNVDDFCAAYTAGEDYSCPGHTNKVSEDSDPKYNGTTPAFSNYKKYPGNGSYTNNNIISSDNINTLRHVLKEEINLRKKHSLYASSIDANLAKDVKAGDIVDHSQQNLVVDVIKKLVDAIKSVPAAANDNEDNHTAPKEKQKVKTGDLIRVHNTNSDGYKDGLKDIEELLVPILNDCICYSDCTNHKSSTRTVLIKVCTCNGNCGCVYW